MSEHPYTGRGTGRTTRQMQSAPQGALYVVAQRSEREICLRMARDMGRSDLEIVTLDWIRSDRWRGRRFPALVIDHFADEIAGEEDRYHLLHLYPYCAAPIATQVRLSKSAPTKKAS